MRGNTLDLAGFRLAMAITAALVGAGGVVGLAGIRNRHEHRSRAAEIVFDHVTKRYAGRDDAALDDLSLEIPAGTFCVLVGPSGGGKTTALKMVNRLIPFDSGDIRIDGRSDRATCRWSSCAAASAT